jgi:MinD-like ATPase involved in chromosome partitioning or flagellar assembly
VNDRERRVLTEELTRMGFTSDGSPPAAPPAEASGRASREPQPRAPEPRAVERVADARGVAPPNASHRPAPPATRDRPWTRPTAESLTPDTVLRPQRKKPARGWRRVLYTLTGGAVNLGPSPAELRLIQLESRARSPIKGCHRVAIISLKGGVGKTTTTAALGSMFASLRGDRVIAVDANPDRGTLAEKVARQNQATVRDLLADRSSIQRYSDVRDYTSQSLSRLEVLASDSDPGVSSAFSESDYRAVVEVLERYYSLVLTDCGTGLLHSALQGALALADSLIVVSSPSLDGARSASATLDWLEAHDYRDLARNAIAVINSVSPGKTDVDLSRLQQHFGARCRGVMMIPYDPHLAAGAAIDIEELNRVTRNAYLELAALVADGFSARSLQATSASG